MGTTVNELDEMLNEMSDGVTELDELNNEFINMDSVSSDDEENYVFEEDDYSYDEVYDEAMLDYMEDDYESENNKEVYTTNVTENFDYDNLTAMQKRYQEDMVRKAEERVREKLNKEQYGFFMKETEQEIVTVDNIEYDDDEKIFNQTKDEIAKDMSENEKKIEHQVDIIVNNKDEINDLEDKAKAVSKESEKILPFAKNLSEQANKERESKKAFMTKYIEKCENVIKKNDKKGEALIKKQKKNSSGTNKKGEKTFVGKYGIKIILVAFISFMIGVFANSYYYAVINGLIKAKATTLTAFKCLMGFFISENIPLSFIPSKILFQVFGVVLVIGLVSLLLYESFQEDKKRRRQGFEHGNARLGNANDIKKYRSKFMAKEYPTNPDIYENNMLFGQNIGLSLKNSDVNRSANVLVIGGTGTGKTFRYIKPNILQENCSMVITDPSGDIFRSFAPYLINKGYNVYYFNVSNMSISNYFNPLLNVYDVNGEIVETKVDILVDLYMKNAKAGKEAGSSDPFWDKAEKAFLTAMIYYVLENDNIPKKDKCFRTVLEKVQKARAEGDEDANNETELTKELNRWYDELGLEKDESGKVINTLSPRTGKNYKTSLYYDTFLIAPQRTANTILITTAVDLQIFATADVDRITRYNEQYPDMNIDLQEFASTQSYLFLGIPQDNQAYNFLIAMLYSQLYGKLYELGERYFTDKWFIGETEGTPKFNCFKTKQEAEEFMKTVTTQHIVEVPYVNGTNIYYLMWKGEKIAKSIVKETLIEKVEKINKGKMKIWTTKQVFGNDPALPIHINFLLDEFKNIGEIPNFLTILSTSRKYRIGSHVVIQDLGQIKTMYKENEHETLLANVDTTIFLGSIQIEDKEYIQKMLGKTTIQQRSISDSKSGQSISYTPTQVDLMSIDEISAINQNGRNDCIIMVRDCTPFVVPKLNLLEHKRWEAVKNTPKFDFMKYYQNMFLSLDIR